MAKRKNLNEIMQAIASSPDDGMKIFYDDYGKFIFAVAFSVTKKKHLADEAVNEILFRIWKFSSKKNKTVDCLNGRILLLGRENTWQMLRDRGRYRVY